MTPDHNILRRPPWAMALLIASCAHALAFGALFVRISTQVTPSPELPAIAIDMAPPAALPAPVHDVPTPQQVEAPERTPQEQPEPRKLPFDPPPLLNVQNVKPEVVLQPEKKEVPQREKSNPLPPAPTTTQLAAPDLKRSTKTTAALTGGAAAGKATPDAVWDARIRARIELTKRYPAQAARQGQQDDVNVSLTIDRSGRLLNARIRASRGLPLLDEAALEAVRTASPYPKPPAEVEGDPVRLSVIVRFFKRGR